MTYHKRTLTEIEALAKSTELSMVGNVERWKEFLQSTAFLYRYSFPDQILIYAQKPDATACADYETWNEKVYCYIKRGEQGIALIDKTKRSGLRYVFDVTSVEPYKDKGKLPNIWQMQETRQAGQISHLENCWSHLSHTGYFHGVDLMLHSGKAN